MTHVPTTPSGTSPEPGTGGDDAVEPEVRDELPDHLDLPIEVPEADAIEQELEVPTDDEDHRAG